MRKPIDVERVAYEILEEWFQDTLSKTPVQAQHVYTDNIYSKALSVLMAKGAGRIRPLLCEKDGVLRTTPPGREFDQHDAYSDNPAGAATVAHDIGFYAARIDVWCFDHDMLITVPDAYSGGTSSMRFQAGTFRSVDFYTNEITVSNVTTDGAHDGTAWIEVFGSSGWRGS
ncbi:MAG: hypothetical protein GF393_12935 [Armatimonadia bacterium]|nr:hypothetical protein [Armatimonadia bacterium]